MSTARDLPKIAFKDKQDSWQRNEDSKYVLTADNINEIKHVVNSLSDEIGNSIKFSDVYGELRVQVPSDLEGRKKYNLEIQISDDPAFSSIAASASFIDSPSLFSEFKNGKWTKINASTGITRKSQ